MLDIMLLMVYIGGIVAVFKLASDKEKLLTVTVPAFLWPVIVSSILIENYLGTCVGNSVHEWLFKKAK